MSDEPKCPGCGCGTVDTGEEPVIRFACDSYDNGGDFCQSPECVTRSFAAYKAMIVADIQRIKRCYTESWQDETGTIHQSKECEIAALKQENERLHAILDALPVDAEGNPLIGGNYYWFIGNREIQKGFYGMTTTEEYPSCFRTTSWACGCRGTYFKTEGAAKLDAARRAGK